MSTSLASFGPEQLIDHPGSLAVTGPAVKPTAPTRRPSLGARLLAEHEQKCRACGLVRTLGLPPKYLCGAGYVLAIADLRARARRRAS